MDHIQWLPYEYEYEFDRLLRYRYILYHSTNANTFFVTGIKPARSAAMPVLFLLSGPKWVAPINVKFGEFTVTILEPHAILQVIRCKNSIRHIENRFSPYFSFFCS